MGSDGTRCLPSNQKLNKTGVNRYKLGHGGIAPCGLRDRLQIPSSRLPGSKYQLLNNSRLASTSCHRIATGRVLVCTLGVLVWVLIGQHLPECPFDHIGSPVIGVAKEMSIDIERDGWRAVPEASRDGKHVHARGDKL